MKEAQNRLIASLALFSELYNDKKDIYHVLADFVESAIVTEAKWTFTAPDVKYSLKSIFDFEIPEAVIKTVITSILKKKKQSVIATNGKFEYVGERINVATEIAAEFDSLRSKQKLISDNLTTFVSQRFGRPLTDEEEQKLRGDFIGYLIDNEGNVGNADLISTYIILNQKRPEFVEALNVIREGTILYEGIRYTNDLNDIGIWNTKLTLFLDTEILFNALGCNGEVFSEVFSDFNDLVKGINVRGALSQKKIELRYFEETRKEIEGFFAIAERILDGRAVREPSKPAMEWILNGCHRASDVITKKASFFQTLMTLGIHAEEPMDYYKNPSHVVEGASLIEELRHLAQEEERQFVEEDTARALRMFTKINALRRGNSSLGFERVGFILLTGKNTTLRLASRPEIKNNSHDVPFATDVFWITNRFWFKSKKGLGSKKDIPRSFDIITRAQIVLSAQLSAKVSNEYHSLKKQLSSGSITQDEAKYSLGELRAFASKPEEINADTVEDSLTFLNEGTTETHLRERSALQERARKGEEAIRKLSALEFSRRKVSRNIRNQRIRIIYRVSWAGVALVCAGVGMGITLWVNYLITPPDTPVAITSLVLAIVFGLLGLISSVSNVARPFKRKFLAYLFKKIAVRAKY